MLKNSLKIIDALDKSSYTSIKVGNSLFTDDLWNLSEFIPKKGLSPSAKRINFGRIKSPQLQFTVKQYAYYKLGQIKPQSVIGIMNNLLSCFIPFADINKINSFTQLNKILFLKFADWMKTERKLSNKTGYMGSFIVEEIIRIGQIKGWQVPDSDVLTGVTAVETWGSSGNENSTNKVKPIPEDIFNKILECALKEGNNIITKAGIIIQSQTGLRIGEVLSIQEGCIKQSLNAPPYLEITLSKTEKGEPVIHKVYVNQLVINAVNELTVHTKKLRIESDSNQLFLVRRNGIRMPSSCSWSTTRLRTFIRKWNILDKKGELYHLKSHQFRATFVRNLIMKNIPISYIMKQFSHVSIEMTCHYLTLREKEIKDIYSRLIFSPNSIIAGKRAIEIKTKVKAIFRGKTEKDINKIINNLADTLSFNPLPNGLCLYDFRRGNCAEGDGCFFYNCPNYITEVSFLPVLTRELKLLEAEMKRTKQLGYERQWQKQYIKYEHLKPLVESLEVTANEKER